ncbi:transposase [Streptomyces sp. NPDC004728]|uniref:transposase n=1 Tax=Streptomyces sp. NPDC004728 TaxID=3154289 RepID=UPI0033AC1F14
MAGVIDWQSVKADAVVGAGTRGFDGGKLVNGRKRHVVVDTLGLLLGVMVTAADVGDRAAAHILLEQVAAAHHRLALVRADGGYTGSLIEHCLAAFAPVLAIVKRSDSMKGFVVLPKRWIVERLSAHLMRSRSLARDFERRIASAEAMIYWPMAAANWYAVYGIQHSNLAAQPGLQRLTVFAALVLGTAPFIRRHLTN